MIFFQFVDIISSYIAFKLDFKINSTYWSMQKNKAHLLFHKNCGYIYVGLTITVTLTRINLNTFTANWIHKAAQIVHGILGAEYTSVEHCKNLMRLFQSGVSKQIWKHGRRATDGLALRDRQWGANPCNTIKRKVTYIF